MSSGGNNFNDFPENQLAKFRVEADLPERCCISVPAVINIYWSAVPAQKYLPEQHSATFRHHYTPASTQYHYRADISGIGVADTAADTGQPSLLCNESNDGGPVSAAVLAMPITDRYHLISAQYQCYESKRCLLTIHWKQEMK